MSATASDRRIRVAAERKHSLHKQRMWALWGSYIALGVFVFMFLVPPFYTLMTSLKSSAEISAQTGSPWLVRHPTLENFWYLITYPNFQRYYLNSIIVTILTVAISMVISVLAAFSLVVVLASLVASAGLGALASDQVLAFRTDEGDVALKCPTEVSITDRREKELAERERKRLAEASSIGSGS